MKHILREAVKDLLPASVYRRTDKKGMPTPIATWFRGSLADWIREELRADSTSRSGLLDRGYVRRALDEHLSRRKDRGNDIWKMLCVESWWRVFVEGHMEFAPSRKADTVARETVSLT